MPRSLQSRILRREVSGSSDYATVRGFYGDQAWVHDLDIVNELGGHSGCVNALSWSRSGRLLASGSDDQHLNIHAYQPDSSTSPFALSTTVSTGHTANIFSVKFMPHSNDRTLVTCAGDHDVRIFDIEYSGSSTLPSEHTSSSRRRGLNTIYNGVRYLGEVDTNAKVYRSHADRVKRIVTESSPHLFLTCSEDGEVRQWDLRQPSSAYPPPRGGRGFLASRRDHDDSNVPPPLISYKRYRLDLNTISCSPSQPHYIALGGAHLHCFLHDRRMLGRDLLAERGDASPASSRSVARDDQMGQATRCVRRFAPSGTKKMRRTDTNHITACKISDANPNEMVVSWSGEHIYSFDLARSPDAQDGEGIQEGGLVTGQGRRSTTTSRDRKRKREHAGSNASSRRVRGESKPRQDDGADQTTGELALRVRYENGQSEDIPIEAERSAANEHRSTASSTSTAREPAIPLSQHRSFLLARAVVSLRKEVFGLDTSAQSLVGTTPSDPTGRAKSFGRALYYAAKLIRTMDAVIRTWRYPVNPDEEAVTLQRTLRRNREASRRFVQAAGTLSRVLGGIIPASNDGDHPALAWFKRIEPFHSETNPLQFPSQFDYDFLKAILAWLDGGLEGLLQCFMVTHERRKDIARYPVPEGADLTAIDSHLLPYLLHLATGRSLTDIDHSRFERDEYRVIFETDSSAVTAFSNAIKMPLEPNSSVLAVITDPETGPDMSAVQDKQAAVRFWGFKVGRSLLMRCGEGVNYAFVDRAFGGLGVDHVDEERSQEDVDMDEEEEVLHDFEVVRVESRARTPATDPAGTVIGASTTDPESAQPEQDSLPPYSAASASVEEVDTDEEMSLSGIESEGESSDDDDDDGDGDSDDALTAGYPSFIYTSAFDRSRQREQVEKDVPCSSHTRQYRGHCNVKTVKDVNFFGLQDEYVVSGSDCGNLFIWDRRTTQLVNILEGDGEVVNVVQGHPYEPMLAVSGIDHTIKIFSPDRRAQSDARTGSNICDPNPAGYSTLHLGGRTRLGRRRPRPTVDASGEPEEEGTHDDQSDDSDDDDRVPSDPVGPSGLASRKRMHRSYEITSQNDVERQGGMRDAYITVRYPRRSDLPLNMGAALPRISVDFAEWLGWFG
ncbi:MAG: hypothetical protein M1817_002727 [Caeruleum heppii]|nr:MAG: hypothetical protein M1817_002727 [Caeruleum heppii]